MRILGDTREAAALRRRLETPAPGDPAPHATSPLVIDARHPFDASEATERVQSRDYVRLRRAPWRRAPGDRWIETRDAAAAAAALEPGWTRVLLALGCDVIEPFQGDPDRRYFVRVRGGAQQPLPLDQYEVLSERGPFSVEGEVALFRALGLHAIVARNVGGPGAYPKIEAARRLGVPVVLTTAPDLAVTDTPVVETVEQACAWAVTRGATLRADAS